MADNVELNAASGGAILATDDVGGIQFQKIKLDVGGDGVTAPLSNSSPLPVSDAGGSLTIDAPVGTPAFVRLSDGSAAITTLPVSLATVPSHAVTNAGTFVVQENGAALTALQLIDNLVLAEDAGHSSGDPGVQMLAVRNDADASLAGTSLDYTPLQVDANGYLKVNIKAGAGSGGTASTDDAAFTVAVGSFTPAGGYYNSTKDAVDSGDGGVFAMNIRRAQYLVPDNVVSTANSSTANLAGAAAFTGTSEDMTDYSLIQVSVFSSHVSATDGLSLQQSSDGTNWDITDTYTVSATSAKVVSVQPAAKFFRLVYTNGATLTTSLRIQTVFKVIASKGSSQRPADATSNENDFEQISAFTHLFNGTTWDRLRGDITNGVDVDVTRVSGTVAVTQSGAWSLSANQSVNVAQLAGTTTDTNSGNKSAGTLRVVLATDQPALTNKLLVTPDSVALPANQSVNVAQVNGVTTLMGNGVTGTGSQRVTIVSDNTAFSVNATSAGAAAHDAAVSGNPTRVAGRGRTSDYTSVANDDTADVLTTLNGKIVTQPFAIPELSWSSAAASGGIVNTTGVTAKAAAAAGIRNYVTRAQIINGHATVDTDIQIRDGAAGTVLWRGFAKAAGGGVACDFDPPLKGTAATLVEIACGTTGSAVYFNLQGYTGP